MHRILLSTLAFFLIQGAALAHTHSMYIDYVPWGIDEYELWDLNKKELTERFKGKLNFDAAFTKAMMGGSSGPQFLLTWKGDRVIGVQRLFIDGAGCNLKGPVLCCKCAALRFSINGLSGLAKRDAADEKRLKEAKALLAKLEEKK